MEDDHNPLECRDCQLEAMANYADTLEADAAHSEVTGHDHLRDMIVTDALEYWTGGDERWLTTITGLIRARRQVITPEAGPKRRFRLARGRHHR